MSNTTITAPLGFRASGVRCGLKTSDKTDLGLILCDQPATVAGCFTKNQVTAAPVEICRKHITSGLTRGLVVNSGNANACTGPRGLNDATLMTKWLAEKINAHSQDILVASTGIIGKFLDMEKIERGIDLAYSELSDSESSGMNFSQAILTTDTSVKLAYREFDIGGQKIKLAGTAKGSGMISPNMATMLAFITTDAKLSPVDLHKHLSLAVEQSFNRITVDGEMSTNDTVLLFASGLACDEPLDSDGQDTFSQHLLDVCNELALAIVKDGEGASKVFHVAVTGASSCQQAHTIARAVANSLLVKTAIHGGDPNWGRIISAAGACHVPFCALHVTCSIGNEIIFKNGLGTEFDTEKLNKIMAQKDIRITLDLGEGDVSQVVHSCDLSKEYIDINAFYHT